MNLNSCSFPIRENASKPPNGGKCSSALTNKQSKPQQGKTRRNLREGISRNCKFQRQYKLKLNGINSEVPAVQFQRRSELAPKGINCQAPAKAKRNPWEGISGDFIPKGNSSWRQKEVNSKMLAGQFIRSVKFLRISELAPKGNNYEVPAGYFCASGIIST